MPRPKKIKELIPEPQNEISIQVPVSKRIEPLTQHFGNGDLNTLRDKINEIIESK